MFHSLEAGNCSRVRLCTVCLTRNSLTCVMAKKNLSTKEISILFIYYMVSNIMIYVVFLGLFLAQLLCLG